MPLGGVPIVIRKLIDLAGRRLSGRPEPVVSSRVARIPGGLRVYVVGDIHGRADLLSRLLTRMDIDEAARPVQRCVTVFLGDYVDRGLQSRQVIDLLIARQRDRPMLALRGNHDDSMLRALNDTEVALRWLAAGGRETLHSYGVAVPVDVNRDTVHTVIASAAKQIPDSHRVFLERLRPYARIGDYAFSHAGIRPGIPLESQSLEDLTSIRQPFLDCATPHEFVIVHGHTPVHAPDFRANRINIDTGAYITGNLTCLVLEEDRRSILTPA